MKCIKPLFQFNAETGLVDRVFFTLYKGRIVKVFQRGYDGAEHIKTDVVEPSEREIVVIEKELLGGVENGEGYISAV